MWLSERTFRGITQQSRRMNCPGSALFRRGDLTSSKDSHRDRYRYALGRRPIEPPALGTTQAQLSRCVTRINSSLQRGNYSPNDIRRYRTPRNGGWSCNSRRSDEGRSQNDGGEPVQCKSGNMAGPSAVINKDRSSTRWVQWVETSATTRVFRVIGHGIRIPDAVGVVRPRHRWSKTLSIGCKQRASLVRMVVCWTGPQYARSSEGD